MLDTRVLGISEVELALRVAQGDTSFGELLQEVREGKKEATKQPESEGVVPVQISLKASLEIKEHGKRGFKSKVICPTPAICRVVLSIAERYMLVSRRTGSRIFYAGDEIGVTRNILDDKKTDISNALADL